MCSDRLHNNTKYVSVTWFFMNYTFFHRCPQVELLMYNDRKCNTKSRTHSGLNTNSQASNHMLSIFFCRMCWRSFLACDLANINLIYVQFNAHQVKHLKRIQTNENVKILAIRFTVRVHSFFCTPHNCNGSTASEIWHSHAKFGTRT